MVFLLFYKMLDLPVEFSRRIAKYLDFDTTGLSSLSASQRSRCAKTSSSFMRFWHIGHATNPSFGSSGSGSGSGWYTSISSSSLSRTMVSCEGAPPFVPLRPELLVCRVCLAGAVFLSAPPNRLLFLMGCSSTSSSCLTFRANSKPCGLAVAKASTNSWTVQFRRNLLG